MSEKHGGVTHSAAAASNPAYMAEESSAAIHPRRTRRNKHIRVAVGIVFFIVFHTLLLLALGSIIPITKPKYRIQSVTFEDLHVSDDFNAPSSFNMNLTTLVILKNSNPGAYRFGDASLTFSYKGTKVGEVVLNKSSVHMLSKKRMRVVVNLSSDSVPRNLNLAMDIASGALPLSGSSQLMGKVEYMKVIKRDESAALNCSLTINLLGKALQKLRCD